MMIQRGGNSGVLAAIAIAACTSLCGCKGNGSAQVRTEVTPETRMSVHDLTRVTLDGADRGDLNVHVAFADASGEVIRPLGVFRVMLHRPAEPGVGGGTAQKLDRSWEVDLRDPVRNAAAYDEFITRTYVLELRDAPAWLRQWARASDPGAERPNLVVEFTPERAGDGAGAGEAIVLRVGVPVGR